MHVSLPPFHFTIQMWGDAFVEPFVEVTLPLLLSANNLPAIERLDQCVFDLYTTRKDIVRIKECPAYKRLEGMLKVEVNFIDDMDRSHHHSTMSECNRLAIKKCDDHGRIIVFLQPDTCVADGTLKNMQKVMQEGKRVVQIAGFRTKLEEVMPAMRTFYDASTDSITLRGTSMIDMVKNHIHPISQSLIWDSDHFSDYNSHIYWRVADEGFFMRCCHFHPLAVYPRVRHAQFDFTVDYNYFDVAVPEFEDYYIATDSEEMCMCEMSRAHYFIGNANPGYASALRIALWIEGYATLKHRLSFAKKIYMHTGKRSSEEWKKTEDFSDQMLAEAFEIIDKPLAQLFGRSYFYKVWAERTRNYFNYKVLFHPSDRWFIFFSSKIVPLYKAWKNHPLLQPHMMRQRYSKAYIVFFSIMHPIQTAHAIVHSHPNLRKSLRFIKRLYLRMVKRPQVSSRH